MGEYVPKYIQKAIDDLRVKNEKLKKTSYILFLIIICFLGYKEYTGPRYFDFGCVDVIFSNDFVTLEFNGNVPREYEGLNTSELDRTKLFKNRDLYRENGDRKKLSISEIYNLNRNLKDLKVGDCVGFLDYYFDNKFILRSS